MQTAKDKLRTIVQNYTIAYADEYEQFKRSNKININKNKDKFGTFGTGNDFIERKMIEIPENLFVMIKMGLEDNEFDWLFPENNPNNEGIRWFVKAFPTFKAMETL